MTMKGLQDHSGSRFSHRSIDDQNELRTRLPYQYGQDKSLVFRLPKKIQPSQQSTHRSQRKYNLKEEIQPKKRELGSLGKEYDYHLRMTAYNLAKEMYKTKRKRSLQEQKSSEVALQLQNINRNSIYSLLATLKSENETIKLLQKYTHKPNQNNQSLEVQARRLPAIRRSRKKKIELSDVSDRWDQKKSRNQDGYSFRQRKMDKLMICPWDYDQNF